MKRIYLHNIMVSVMAALMLASCDMEDAEPKTVSNYPSFSATIEGSGSRAHDTSWDIGDKIGISVTDGSVSGGNVAGGGATNLSHITAAGDGLFEVEKAANQIIFTDDNQVEFTAYYPYKSNRPANGIITSISTSGQTNQKNFDYLWAKAYGSKSKPDVKFEFAHVMSKISFSFKNGDEMDVSEIASYTLSGFRVASGSFNTNTGEVSTTAAKTGTMTVSVKDVKPGEPVTPCIVIPQTLDEIPVQLNIKGSGSPFVYLACQLPFKDAKIEAGYEYRFVITVNKTGLTIDAATISDWEPDDRGDDWNAW